jgi:type I restriction enzyme S subunit
MSSEWKVKKLGDILTLQRGHDLPSQERKFGHVPIMGSSGVTGYHDQYKAKGPGVIVGRSGNSMGQVSYVSEDYWPLNTSLYVTDFKGNCPEFIYYFLKQINFDQFNSGSAQKSLNRNVVYPFEVKFPSSYKTQSAIASILFTLEQKIEFNQKINQTLEQMAQALFKSWFVDFEPVKTKIAVLEAGGSQEEATLAVMTAISGKDSDALVIFEREHPEQYAELKATAELFPSAMQDSELGEIPEGWCIDDLSSLASLNAESWSKKNAPDSVSYVDLANTKWGVINSIETYQFSDAPSRARRILKPRDTIVGTVRPGNGSYAYISKTGLTGSTGFAVLTPKNRIFSEYIYLCVTSNESIERLAHLADGGAYPAVNADVVLSTQCVLPVDREILETLLNIFSSRTEMFFSYRTNNLDQNEMLSCIRDTLLPKLLSGEITLPEAEQAVSEAENV